MSYKTILVHVDQSEHTASRVRIAAEIAVMENAHLIGAAMTGISRFAYQDGESGLAGTMLANHADSIYQHANDALALFENIAAKAGAMSCEKRLLNDDAHGGLCLQAGFCDLIVLGQIDPDETFASTLSDLPEHVVLNGGRPVLIVPHSGRFDGSYNRILVAWDGSREATRALTDAIPLLRRAKNVTVALLNPDVGAETHGEQPGADIALFLARHDIRIEVMQQKTDIDVGNALLSLVTDLGSDLIVMGGYGHTRFREALLGGVTRTVLQTMTVPVLMSH